MRALSSDTPISTPPEDRYRVDPFAKAIANALAEIKTPDGIVVGIDGQWGSGKTSVLGLVRHHLKPHIDNEELVLVDFAPWWFAGQEALTRAFFYDVGGKIEKSLGAKLKGAFQSLGKRIGAFGEAAGTAAEAGTQLPGTGAAVKGAAGIASSAFGAGETVVEAQLRLAQQLKEQKKRFVVIIDDIDRLSPVDAIELFRLVKSVGQMPNITYLLALDRELAEKVVKEKYPSEGAHYLEKIVQVWFDLPPPELPDLRHAFLTQFAGLLGAPQESILTVRLMNTFYAIVAPHFRTPRDVVRLLNTLRVSYPAVKGEVDIPDCLGIEGLRLFRPTLHGAIARNKGMLCGRGGQEYERGEQRKAAYDKLLLASVNEEEKAAVRSGLCRLFPRLESVWNNQGYGASFEEKWRTERRICSEDHFPSYFRFSLGDRVLPAKQLEEIFKSAGDEEATKRTFRGAAAAAQRAGDGRAPVLLEELTSGANRIEKEAVPKFLTALYETADEFGLSNWDTRVQLHMLVNRLLVDRFSMQERSSIVLTATRSASLRWLADFAVNCKEAGEKGRGNAHGDQLVDAQCSAAIQALAVSRLEAAANDGSLLKRRDVCALLYRWGWLSEASKEPARELVTKHLGDDGLIVALAKATLSESTVTTQGDLVSRRERSVRLETIKPFVDIEVFSKRVDEVLTQAGLGGEERKILEDFRTLPHVDPETDR